MSKCLILSHGIRNLKYLKAFLPECRKIITRERADFQIVAGWGFKKTAEQARKIAQKHAVPYWALEDGFLRSIRLGRDGEPPMSLVVDPIGIYYDAHASSQLEQWLEEGFWSSPELLGRAKSVQQQLVDERLSKYNHSPEKNLWPGKNQERVLVIDQTFEDMSVVGGLATEKSFHDMLQAAVGENPQAQVVVKIHPDVLAGHRKGYLGAIPNDPRIRLLTEDVHPWCVLDGVSKVYTVSSLLGFEALIAGKSVRCFGMPFYAGWGLTEDEFTCSRRTRSCTLDEVFAAAYLKYARYIDPISGQRCEIERIIDLLADRRRHWLQTQGLVVCSGVSSWKRSFLPGFLGNMRRSVRFVKKPETAINRAAKTGCRWALWASAETDELRQKATQREVSMIRVEDAFLRSVGLGSDLVRPWSLVLDDEGIYYDASRPSRLETLLRETEFSDGLLRRAEELHRGILEYGLTKYNVGNLNEISFVSGEKPLVLVPGQVEDDASILRGSPEIKKNLDLLRAVRDARPEAYIIYKPHPDVLVGNRRGGVDSDEALRWCDQVVTDVSMNGLLDCIDEVHTLTSLAGFEALLRGCRVVTYGLPFYAGWGLTEDRLSCPRRGRRLSLEQLVAGALILYPTYVDPVSNEVCSVEDLITWLVRNRQNPIGPSRKTRLIRRFQHWRQG